MLTVKDRGLPSRTMTDRLLNTDEAAKFLGINSDVLRRMVREGRIGAIRVGDLLRFRTSDLLLGTKKKEKKRVRKNRRRGS